MSSAIATHPRTRQLSFTTSYFRNRRSESMIISMRQHCNAGFSFGAYDGELLVGLIIAEPQEWNRSLCVWEFHVAATHRRSGIGRQLMACAEEQARRSGLRTIVCETQNTNAAAIMVYRKLGFTIE